MIRNMTRWWQPAKSAWRLCALGLVLLLVACGGRPTATPAPDDSFVAPIDSAEFPEANSTILIEPETGGAIRLRGGAGVTLPPQALSERAAVTLRIARDYSAVPIPRSLLGNVYELALEGGELTGLALLRLPIPPEVNVGEYDLAPYRWNGSTWERMNGRVANGEVQVGLNTPALVSLQGQWNLADASLTLVRVDGAQGALTLPLTVAGQYRYSTLPMLSGDVVPATLRLKQDTSGGGGRVAGNEALDATLDEAVLWFKPDPAMSQARIEFSHVFELNPAQLDLAPGATTRFYVVLVVEDSAAPTRRLSTAVEYAQIVPIRISGREVVRLRLIGEERYSFRWHVRLNDQTFSQTPATGTALDIDGLLAQGGLGAYRISLEANVDGAWVAVSNEVSIELALRPTSTPEPGTEPPLVALVSPTPQLTPAAPGTPLVPPTRRPGPSGGVNPGAGEFAPTPTPTVALMSTVTPTATRFGDASIFWADSYGLTPGACTTIHWQVENVTEVYFENAPVVGSGAENVCPTQTTIYRLRTISGEGTRERTLTITVGAAGEAPLVFVADAYHIVKGQCTDLRWSVTNVAAVRLNGEGVAGEAVKNVCPDVTTDYVLQVQATDGTITTRKVTINVSVTDRPLIRFWADRYALAPNSSTVLHWHVENVQSVTLDGQGVNGIDQASVTPGNRNFYTLQVTTTEGQALTRQLNFIVIGEPQSLPQNHVIAQGIVRNVEGPLDVDLVNPGDQPGYRVTIDSIGLLFSNALGWNQAMVRLGVPQSMIDQGDAASLHWPVGAPQPVEFRAVCQGTECMLVQAEGAYLYLRGP
jgi:hypothetical protein